METLAGRKASLAWDEVKAALAAEPKEEDFNPEQSLVTRGVVPPSLLGWDGHVVRISTREVMTFYPSTPQHSSVFTDAKHKREAAAIKPSVEFWQWLAMDTPSPSDKTWQMRGSMKLQPQDLVLLLDPGTCPDWAGGEAVRVGLLMGGVSSTPIVSSHEGSECIKLRET